ncbi:leucine-rich repeats and immunoglobulin-like domains protein 3 [Drosophila tropicalis]|uniref:leucine-rich repeats and immunoglobulin-like domains protein 3 n=1 Tax=Drosophila tropicalis TaxID=46794 RepID=UPI0035AB9A19
MHVLDIKQKRGDKETNKINNNQRIWSSSSSSSSNIINNKRNNSKFIMFMSGLASLSTNWRRRRRRHNDNCNYTTTTTTTTTTTNDFNKINKLLLITYILLITATTICQSLPTDAGGGVGGGGASPPLTELLKSGGATYNHQLPQQQLFAMLAKSGGGGGGLGAGSPALALAKRQHFLPLDDDESADNGGGDIDNEDFASLHIPLEFSHAVASSSKSHAAASSLQSASLETNGFVADDGGQYELAEKALAAAAASSNAKSSGSNQNNNNINCPKECKCLNVFFDCDKLHLERVPILPNYVQTLHLANNKLNDTSVLEIRNLPSLIKLTLKRNQITVMPKFVGLSALKHLILSNNGIERISSEALSVLPMLKTLDVSRNQLITIEANSFPSMNRLGHLILNGNDIASVAEHAFEALHNLTDLELNNNRLTSLPSGIFQNLTKLKKLALSYNHLEINWSTFRGLLSLQKLQLKANKIRALQDGVFHVMRNIESIELDHNDISSLSRQGFFNLTKLHYLSLSNNSISRIDLDTWEFTQSLESLDLSHNAISEFKSGHLECQQRLKSLNLAHNKLQYLPDNTFDCAKNLEELNLRRNRLAWIIEDQTAIAPFKSLRKLRRLDLHGNNLKQISSKALSGLSSLELLNLGQNALASIQPHAFEHMIRLQKLIFKSLNFICDCELIWFRQWLQTRFAEQSQQMLANVVCGYPEHLLDRPLFSLNNAELKCAESPKPKVIEEPSNMLAVKGANLTLECIATSPAAASLAATDELKIKWRHDNQHVQERPLGVGHDGATTETKIHHDQSTNQTTIYGYLRLTNVTYESAGRYQCVVSNAFGTTYAQKFKISIGIHPSFLHVPSNLTLDAGETARLVCSASGDPMPQIALRKFAGDLSAATERRLQRVEDAFLIINAKPSDSGIYTCTAENAAGEINVNATLIVSDKPQPAIPMAYQEVVVGRTCVLECLSEVANAELELEQPHREWFKENKPIHISPNTPDAERYYFTNSKELLVIVNAQSNDAGHYRCEITDNSRTFTLQSELVVVKENYNWDVLLLGIIGLTVICVLVDCCIIWCTLRYQKRKLLAASRVQASQHTLDIDQTQLTTLNRTQLLRGHQSQLVLDGLPLQQSSATRPRSLADLQGDGQGGPEGQSRLIVTTTPSYEQRCLEQGLTLNYLHHSDLDTQQDHLSSKDSGTGSDAAVKRSLEDFVVAMPRPGHHNEHDGDEDDDAEDNDLQYAPTHALGISEYDDMELYELNHSSPEQQQFLQNNNHNYDGGGRVSGRNGGVAVVPRKCNSSATTSYNPIQQSTPVDI